MEGFLLFLLICLLIYIISTIKNRFDNLEDDIQKLSKKLDNLKPIEKPIEKPVTPPPVIIPKEEIKFEIPKEAAPLPLPIKEEIPEIKTEKVVFSMDTADKSPKPIAPKPVSEPYVAPVPQKSFWENFKEQNPDLEKFIGENLINKIGVLILVLGISYFVKYAIDKDWINEPARVGIGVLCGVLVMGIAHKLRKNYAAFSSVIVAGAIAIFYFTIGIAFHDYHLFNQTVAFSIMVIITAFSALISLSYDRIELAVLSLIGGFAVPFMVSTGEGNYVVLFTYIGILNVGILALAYYKKWNLVNILSYVFTILLYGAWLSQELHKEKPHYLGALIFGFVFYFIFILMNIINNIRTKGEFSTAQLTILASNTFLFYAAGMSILDGYHPELRGVFTTLIALLNLIYAWFLYKKFGLDKRAVYLLIGLTLTFITLAVPIQFEGNYITLFWAAEAVLLLWLSQKSKISSYRFGSVIVNGLMIISLVMDWNKYYNGDEVLNIILNPIFSTGLFATASLFAVWFLLKKETETVELFGFRFNPHKYKKFILEAAFVIGYLTGIFEVTYQANYAINNASSAAALPILYHLVFFAVLAGYLIKKKTETGNQGTVLIALINIILFAFWFIRYAFKETESILIFGESQPIAFYLHYIYLLIIIYFGYLLYKVNSEKPVFSFFTNKSFVWAAAFIVIYITSAELMLHGVKLLNTPTTVAQIHASDMFKVEKLDAGYIRQTLADDTMKIARIKIIKTGFPILWGILAFVFLIIGIKKQKKALRIIALTLLGLTIAKLFLYDISNISETGKIISFILLGILILIISFVYQKIKVLVIDENKTQKTDETE
ncbi:DUF2339 domain-containing protein [Flavobacterium reichenbachii]|uniref:Membrane protein n=1 Tax=Flavobacterium reichenbachii TaxID=362418 RepID=A0A085ZKY6_9FLAO|nr:DUF2339 domain-containing protein [Flavobacterium reichenbachii]KFF05100.1 membrane protein [Flavobacterium reichenbachii]OXB16230.1 hypothetical protein B0A68_08195 [Flavobacterium reichenbachii]